MAGLACEDQLRQVPTYTHKFSGYCPLIHEDVVRLSDQITLSRSDSSTLSYGRDPPFAANPMISIRFSVNNGKHIFVKVGDMTRRIA